MRSETNPYTIIASGAQFLEGAAGGLPHGRKSLLLSSIPLAPARGRRRRPPPPRACKNSSTRLGEHKLLLVVEEKPEYVVPVRTTSSFDASEIHL